MDISTETTLSPGVQWLGHTALDISDAVRIDYGERVIKNGHSCDVYSGLHSIHGKVALKRPRMHPEEYGEQSLKVFRREMEIAAGLSHENVLQFLGFCIIDDHLHLVSSFAENGNLSDFVKRKPGVDRCRLLAETADGLAYLHGKGIVHGDIKAMNILVGRQEQALICDFGLSKLHDTLTFTSMKGGGSLRWQAPELWDGQSKTLESDVYAFGMTVYEVLSGQVPFASLSDHAIIKAVCFHNKRPSREPAISNSGMSYDHIWIIAEDCWAEEPGQRLKMVAVAVALTRRVGIGSWSSVQDLKRSILDGPPSDTQDGETEPRAGPFPTCNTTTNRKDTLTGRQSNDGGAWSIPRHSPLGRPVARNMTALDILISMEPEALRRPLDSDQERHLVSRLTMDDSSMSWDGLDPQFSTAPQIPRAQFQDVGRRIDPAQTMIQTFNKRSDSPLKAPTALITDLGMSTLKKLQPSQILTEHRDLVRHLQFSGNGKWLATGSWDRTAIIWKVDVQLSVHRVLAHPGSDFIEQVAWSSDNSFLLTKTHRTLKIWTTQSGVCYKTINRSNHIEAVTWLRNGKHFACVELNRVYFLATNGNVISTHSFLDTEISDVAFTAGERRMILVGTRLKLQGKPESWKHRADHCILVYRLADNSIEQTIPLSKDVRHITVSRDNEHALVSYEDQGPPELWELHLVKGEPGRLAPLRAFNSPTGVEFAGPSYFGGAEEQFIIRASKNGEIHVWDRENGIFLHSLEGAPMTDGRGEGLTSIAWNHNTPGLYMIASATHDGVVKIWTTTASPNSS